MSSLCYDKRKRVMLISLRNDIAEHQLFLPDKDFFHVQSNTNNNNCYREFENATDSLPMIKVHHPFDLLYVPDGNYHDLIHFALGGKIGENVLRTDATSVDSVVVFCSIMNFLAKKKNRNCCNLLPRDYTSSKGLVVLDVCLMTFVEQLKIIYQKTNSKPIVILTHAEIVFESTVLNEILDSELSKYCEIYLGMSLYIEKRIPFQAFLDYVFQQPSLANLYRKYLGTEQIANGKFLLHKNNGAVFSFNMMLGLHLFELYENENK